MSNYKRIFLGYLKRALKPIKKDTLEIEGNLRGSNSKAGCIFWRVGIWTGHCGENGSQFHFYFGVVVNPL